MQSSVQPVSRNDGRLWAIALGLSLPLNAGLLLLVGFATIRSERLERRPPETVPAESVVTIFPEIAKAAISAPESSPAAAPEPPPAAKPRFARTSEDQAAALPETKPFIGERNTVATSDRAPDPAAPDLPSQKGRKPWDADELETTESNYRDGSHSENQSSPALPDSTPSNPMPPAPVPPVTDPAVLQKQAQGEKMDRPGTDETKSSPPAPEPLVTGPNPVDVEIPKPATDNADIKPTPAKRPKDGGPPEKPSELPKPAARKPVNDPAFVDHVRKTAIVGSISRNGRSALNVADTPLGRYQATISRAVAQEWQLNCVRHRDFITPGYLTVRFFVEPSGKVRTVQFVGQMQTGEVQKGFTLNSIRDAEIPAMPAALKKEYEDSPLELIFNFIF